LATLILLRIAQRRCRRAKTDETVPEKPKSESEKTYEQLTAAMQYLEFHYTPGKVSFPYDVKLISEAFDFPVNVAKYVTTGSKYKPAGGYQRALDVGCATGAASFELSRVFQEVVGVDLSSTFINFANQLKDGTVQFYAPDQGDSQLPRTGSLPAGTNPKRVTFAVGDALNLDPALGQFDAVLASNLLCRVPDPDQLLLALHKVVNIGGVLVVSSPYSWWEGATPKEKWLGGEPKGPKSEDLFKKRMSALGFELLHEGTQPFLIRDHHRRFQLGIPHLTVWRKRE